MVLLILQLLLLLLLMLLQPSWFLCPKTLGPQLPLASPPLCLCRAVGHPRAGHAAGGGGVQPPL